MAVPRGWCQPPPHNPHHPATNHTHPTARPPTTPTSTPPPGHQPHPHPPHHPATNHPPLEAVKLAQQLQLATLRTMAHTRHYKNVFGRQDRPQQALVRGQQAWRCWPGESSLGVQCSVEPLQCRGRRSDRGSVCVSSLAGWLCWLHGAGEAGAVGNQRGACVPVGRSATFLLHTFCGAVRAPAGGNSRQQQSPQVLRSCCIPLAGPCLSQHDWPGSIAAPASRLLWSVKLWCWGGGCLRLGGSGAGLCAGEGCLLAVAAAQFPPRYTLLQGHDCMQVCGTCCKARPRVVSCVCRCSVPHLEVFRAEAPLLAVPSERVHVHLAALRLCEGCSSVRGPGSHLSGELACCMCASDDGGSITTAPRTAAVREWGVPVCSTAPHAPLLASHSLLCLSCVRWLRLPSMVRGQPRTTHLANFWLLFRNIMLLRHAAAADLCCRRADGSFHAATVLRRMLARSDFPRVTNTGHWPKVRICSLYVCKRKK